ncbi:MAG TPA: hypothetical protein VHV51_19730 [Polyangiaceae bacterium]|nr:hypothetical protein [Polyangiaceae bacterium]
MRSSSYIAGMFSLPKVSAVCLVLGFFGLGGASGCLYDSSNRCDPGETYDSNSGLCICTVASNSTTGDHGCVPCPMNQHRSPAPDGGDPALAPDTCVCDDGFVMTSNGDCVSAVQGLGDPCTTGDDCTNSDFKFCQMSAIGGYCTQMGCASDDDCAGGYNCNTTASPSFCQRPPVGEGMACMSDTDCAGTEATYCVTALSTDSCAVRCTPGDDSPCASGEKCCDLPHIAVTQSLFSSALCVPPAKCP